MGSFDTGFLRPIPDSKKPSPLFYKKWATGVTSNGAVTGLTFLPKVIFAAQANDLYKYYHAHCTEYGFRNTWVTGDAGYGSPTSYWVNLTITSSGFSGLTAGIAMRWVAIG